MEKIFINDSVIILSEEKTSKDASHSVRFSEFKQRPPDAFLENLEKNEGTEITIWGENSKKMLDYFAGNLKNIAAGGGLVQNPRDEILFIFRHNKWDLPKGKPENKEDITETAKREVEEECGISKLSILSSLPSTHHIYPLANDKYVLKKCYWFHMRSARWKTIKVQKEEGITEARWLSMPIDSNIMQLAYPSIRELVTYFENVYCRGTT